MSGSNRVGMSRRERKSLALVTALTVLLAVWSNCARSRDHAVASRVQRTSHDFPDSPTGDALARHFEVMVQLGPDADSAYQVSLTYLRRNAPQVVPELNRAYARMDPMRHFRRWCLVETLRELHTDLALHSLVQIASSPLPPGPPQDSDFSYRSRECHIRATAVDGLGELARGGNKTALRALLPLTRHSYLGIRRRAVRAYLAAGADTSLRAAELRKLIPASDHWLITLQVTDVAGIALPRLAAPRTSGEILPRNDAPRVR
jgi:hypothetical protein